MKPFLIIYFSGVGNTKRVAEMIKEYSEKKIQTEIFSVEKLPADFSVNNYSAMVIGTPTYHSEPAKPLIKFFDSINTERKIPAFIFTTCGLYSENCLRILTKECLKHNIIPVYNSSYRCSATDGILLAPFMKCWFKDETNLNLKIKSDFRNFTNKLKTCLKMDLPQLKWYTLLNFPNKTLGKKFTFPIYLHKDKCIKCGKCLKNCPQNAITEINNYPEVRINNCMNCYRCIHHCPVKALSLSKYKPVSKVWRENERA